MIRYVCLCLSFLNLSSIPLRPSFKTRLTGLAKGYVDREFHEKAKTMDDKLTVWDFRFLSIITGKDVVNIACRMSLAR